jgi:hypothetical protein
VHSTEAVTDKALDTAALIRAQVHAVHDESVTAVSADGTRISCDVLRNGTSPPRLDVGDEVVVWAPGGAEGRGVILGVVGRPRSPDAAERDRRERGQAPIPDELVLEARCSLTLRVGDGSITIREDGKILIKGRDLVSHALRTNRIKGGAVAIN